MHMSGTFGHVSRKEGALSSTVIPWSLYVPFPVWNVGRSRGLDSGLLTVGVWRREAPEVLSLRD